jgi:hypothetical protein
VVRAPYALEELTYLEFQIYIQVSCTHLITPKFAASHSKIDAEKRLL